MNGFYLKNSLKDCPIYWQNFIKCLQKLSGYENEDVPDKMLNEYLRLHKATIKVDAFNQEIVLFKDAKHFEWFVIKWA